MKTRTKYIRRLAGAVAAAVVMVFAAAACGSSGGSTPASTGASGAVKFTGSPIKIGMIADVNTVVVWNSEVSAERGAILQVNKAGGINGHEVVLDFCNENLNPNTALACARRLVNDHVIAAACNGVVTAESGVNTILANAGIANVGPVSFSGASGSDPNSYMLRGDENYSIAALAKYSVSAGYKRIGLAILDSPITDDYTPVLSGSLKALGGTLVAKVLFPQVTSDVSTQAAAMVAAKPQAVMLELSPAAGLQLMKDMSQLGYTGKFLSDGSQFLPSDVAGLGAIANQLLFTSPFPPASASNIKGIAEFEAAMKAEAATGDADTPTDPQVTQSYQIQAWLAVIAIQRIADAAKAVNSVEFKKAIDATKDLNLDGIIPPWTPNASDPSSPEPRVSNGSFFEFYWSNGKSVLASNKQINVSSLIDAYMPRAS